MKNTRLVNLHTDNVIFYVTYDSDEPTLESNEALRGTNSGKTLTIYIDYNALTTRLNNTYVSCIAIRIIAELTNLNNTFHV